MNGLEELFAKAAPKAGIQGNWFTARWQPDMATGEVLNIGVGFVSSEGELSLRLLNEFSRLECLFDSSNAAFHAELACQVVDECMRSNPQRRGNILAGVTIEERGFAQGADNESIVDRLYADVVTLGRPKATKGKKKPFVPVSRDVAYDKVKKRLKLALKMDYGKHVPEDPFKEVSDIYGNEKLYLPFQRDNGVATLTSAAYADPWRVKSQLFEGFRAVETALKNKISENAALFVVMPGEGLTKETFQSLEKEFEEFYAFVQRHEIQMESHEDLDELGVSVSDWCLGKAA
ncbi:hypothetical protein [Marinobacter sp.]|uniref:hypothetical protein n=1 Tax=Marinobacter sp. TaxID=50741 RepID=UPI003A9448E6